MPTKISLPDNFQDFIVSNKNLTNENLAEFFKVSTATIKRWKRDSNIKIKNRHRKIAFTKEEAIDLYNRFGGSISSIAKEKNCSRAYVRSLLNEYNIKLKKHRDICSEINSKNSSPKPSKEEFIEKYYTEKLTLENMQKHFSIGLETVYKLFDEYNLDPRSLQESCLLGKEKQFNKIRFSKEEIEEVYKSNYNIGITANKLGISHSYCATLLHKYNIQIIPPYRSTKENEIYEFCKSIRPDVEWVHTDTKLLYPYHLDILCKDLNIAIEYCGLYWHSEKETETKKGKSKTYHYEKYKKCKDLNIKLITVFESDDFDKIKEIIKYKINDKNIQKIRASKCELNIIDSKEAKLFHDTYHLNNYIGSSVNLGLYYNNELIQVVSFSKSRFNKNYEWECTRNSIKFGYSIYGGTSRLFKYFIKEYDVASLITYADLRYGEGKVYEHCGLKYKGTSPPNYWYFKNGTNKLYSRVKYQKYKLSSLLEIFDPNLTEVENMKANGYDRIFDCGNNIYEYIRN